jgi:hypothetical protein
MSIFSHARTLSDEFNLLLATQSREPLEQDQNTARTDAEKLTFYIYEGELVLICYLMLESQLV